MIDSSIDVVVPVYNASDRIETLIERLSIVLSNFRDYRIVFVDDFSSDRSFEKIEKAAVNNSNVIGVGLLRNSGQQRATFEGMKFSKSDYCVTFDDDLKNSEHDIIKLYEELLHGYDAVYGVCKNKPIYGIRSIGSLLRDIVFREITKLDKDMRVSSFRIMNKNLVKEVVKAQGDFVYVSMEVLKHTKNISNIIVDENNKTSRYTLFKLVKLFYKLYIYYKPVEWLMKKHNDYRHKIVGADR